jgi:molecular chaperone DnaK
LTLGIETLGGVMTPLIQRNTTIPTRKSEVFSTAADNQTSVEIHVLQGERSMSRDNRTLGKFQLVGIPPAPRGLPQIDVTFDIDANGIVHVMAKDLGTGKQQDITITASSGLSKEEVERMQKEADAHSDEDRQFREQVEARNQADAMVYNVEKLLSENREKISESEADDIERAIQETKAAIDGNKSAAEINALVERLTKATHKIAEVMYQQASSQSGPVGGDMPSDGGGSAPTQPVPPTEGQVKEGEVIDAEYVDVDENKGQ